MQQGVMEFSNEIIDKVKQAVVQAGAATMDVYNSYDFDLEIKKDNSPLTRADRQSDRIIKEFLSVEFPGTNLISEEGKDIPYEERSGWDEFWLIDPLDGTKEFIKRNGEFTINVAYIVKQQPVFGMIYVPVYDTLYCGIVGQEAWKEVEGEREEITTSEPKEGAITAVMSRSHASDKEKNFYEQFKIDDVLSRGSSLKFCMVAEGKAELYYRGGPTSEWDTGAGHAIVLAAGGTVEGLLYNKKQLLNGSFVAACCKELLEPLEIEKYL